MQGDPPVVRILPDDAGYLHEWRLRGDGSWQAHVTWMEVGGPAYRAGLNERDEWLPADRVQPIPGEDYSRVPRSRAQPERP
jgi:hypothetical protein